jgi:hypothetical protein
MFIYSKNKILYCVLDYYIIIDLCILYKYFNFFFEVHPSNFKIKKKQTIPDKLYKN